MASHQGSNSQADSSVIVALAVTLLAAAVLIPVWIWNAKHQERKLSQQNSSNVFSEVDEEQLQTLTKPGEEFDKQLQSILAKPVNVSGVENEGEGTLIYFSVANETLADLSFPTNKAYIFASNHGSEKIDLLKMTTVNDKQFPPQISKGDEREGVLHFPKIMPGQYILVFPDMQYKSDNQSLFTQEIDLEIEGDWLPRT